MKPWVAVFGLVLVVLAACEIGNGFVVKCDAFASDADRTASASVKVREELVVSLCAEGVLWPEAATIDDPSIVAQFSHNFALTNIVSSDSSPRSAETWSFVGKASGQTTIFLRSSPRGSGGDRNRTYRLVVSVD